MKSRQWVPLAMAAAMVAGQAHAADMAAAPQQQGAASAWTTTANVDFRYFSWERTAGNPVGEPNQKGSQFYMPFGVSTVGQLSDAWKLELNARGGYVNTSRSVDPGDGIYRSASFGSATDTVMGFTVTYLDFNGVVPFYSFNMNLPTGAASLGGYAPITRSDPDLVDIPAYGVGFNHSHTLGANIGIASNTVLTLSAGYTNRGSFTRDSVAGGLPIAATETYDPADVFSVSAGLGMQLGQLSLNLSTALSWENSAYLNGLEVSRSGFNVLLSGTGIYRWNDINTTTLNLSFAHTQPNYTPTIVGIVAGPPLLLEPSNSNSNIFSAGLEHSVMLNPSTQIFGKGGYLYRDNNAYDPANFVFIPAKTKVAAGGGLRYALSQSVLLNAKAEKFWVVEQPYPALLTPEQRFDGWTVSVGSIVKF